MRQEEPLSDFYKHPQMADGHLNKCKECTKKDSINNYNVHSKDEYWMEKERRRGREKFKRLGYRGKFKSPRILNEYVSNINRELRVRGIDTRNKEVHHWNYNEPYSVFLLTRSAHKRIHKHIIVNYNDGYNYTLDNVKIESIEDAKKLFYKFLKEEGINEKIEYYDLKKMKTSINNINLIGKRRIKKSMSYETQSWR